ncbi:MAG: hypothetical protein L3J31_00605 [Bacteroidales bacterium]|nr:hypothetical protein [Bacteroidales bacterium]MCF6341290.1 hypothetical protein [Bacteroidales bacterium]
MKTSVSVKLIGILCIIFGIWGLTENALFILLKTTDADPLAEIAPELQKLLNIHAVAGVLVAAFYLGGGIFFLLKKPFSLNLMYAALVISILFAIIPVIIFTVNPVDLPFFKLRFSYGFFALTGPATDLALLVWVFLISKNYFKPDEVKTSPFLKPEVSRKLSIAGLLCMFVPLSLFGLWIFAAEQGSNHAESLEVYRSLLPSFLHGRLASVFVSLAFGALAIVFSSMGLKLQGIGWKILNIPVLVLGVLLVLLNLFTMM